MAKRGSSSLDATLSQMDKASNKARNNNGTERDGRTYYPYHTIRQNATNGDENEWSRISSATPSYFPIGSQRQPNFDADSAAIHNTSLINVPPFDALNSTEQSTMARIDNAVNELRNMARTNNPAAAPNDNRGAHQYRPLPTNGRIHHGRSIDVSLQSPNREKDGGANQPHDISVPLFTKPRSQAVQKPSTSNDAAIVFWMDELTRYWCSIQDQTKSSLKLMKQDLIRRGLPFDEKFKERFMKSAYEKILIAFEQFLLDERSFNNFFGTTTFASTDTEQRDRINQANHSNDGDIHGIELDDSLVCQQVPPVMLSDIQENSHEATVDEVVVQICNDDSEPEQQVQDEQATGEKVLKVEIPETIDLVSDQEEAMNHGGNDDNQNVAIVAGPSKPAAQRRKKKKKNTKTKENLRRKPKSNVAANTEKRHKCDFCKYSTNKESNLTSHIRIHTFERRFKCKICDKRFTQNHVLNTHMKSHGNLFRFQCSKCCQGFSHKKLWKLHENRCKLRQYECFLCRKIFYQRKNYLLEHMRHKHTGEQPFGCSDCSMRFCTKSGFTRHTKHCHLKGK